MTTPAESVLLKDALIVLGAAATVVPIFHSLKVSPVLGYILIGMVAGPFGLGAWTTEVPWLSYVTIGGKEDIALVAEFGVVLLLFMIGLELSLERLNAMRRLVFGFGGLQVLLSTLAVGAAAYAVVDDTKTAVILGMALAMSSTAVVLQVLSESDMMATSAGRVSFAVLLFQDIAVVPILFAVSMLGQGGEGALFTQLGAALLQATLAIVAILFIGRIGLRPLFRGVARTDSPELFMAACLLVVIATSVATAAAGLSAAMGALIAGLLLAETEYRRQIEVLLEPFKGLMVGVFLISIGMNVDLARIGDFPIAVAIAGLGLIALKALIVTALARVFRLGVGVGVRSGLLLGAGSEFSFIVVALAASLKLISPEVAAFALILVALTMALIPVLHMLGGWLDARLTARKEAHPVMRIPLPADETPRVIVAGFGRVGRVVAALLEAHDLAYIAADTNADTVAAARDDGKPAYYGNMKHPEFMRRCGIAKASALVVTMDSPKAANEVVRLARAERADLKIIVRARDAMHAAELYRIGATDAVPETVEASLQLAEAVLVDVGIAMGPAIAAIHEERSKIRAGIQAAAPDADVLPPPRRRLRDAKPSSD